MIELLYFKLLQLLCFLDCFVSFYLLVLIPPEKVSENMWVPYTSVEEEVDRRKEETISENAYIVKPMHWIQNLQRFALATLHARFPCQALETPSYFQALWAGTRRWCAGAFRPAFGIHWPIPQCSTTSSKPVCSQQYFDWGAPSYLLPSANQPQDQFQLFGVATIILARKMRFWWWRTRQQHTYRS